MQGFVYIWFDKKKNVIILVVIGVEKMMVMYVHHLG